MEIVTEIEDEKRRLDELYDNNVFEEVTYYGDTYLFRIRELLICSANLCNITVWEPNEKF